MKISIATLGLASFVAAGLVSISLAQSARPERSVTQGRGEKVVPNLQDCSQVRGRPSPLGKIRSTDGKEWTTPADVKWREGPRATDLYADCLGVRRAGMQDLDLATVPVVEVDRDGEVITGYLFADNYFELYVNGVFVGADSTLFTPFNSSVVRFRAKRPITYAVKLVDWEENLGLGTEAGRGGAPHPGDGGFIASFSDGTVTDASWRAQSFYIAPLDSPDQVIERAGGLHDTSALGRAYPDAKSPAACGDRCYAVRYRVPADWAGKTFDDRGWPAASLFTGDQVGANQPSFQNFKTQIAAPGAQFIWSSNLVFDNLVLARKTVR